MPSSPTCTVNGGSTSGGVDVTASTTVTVALVDTAARTWLLEVIGYDDSQGSAPALTINHVARTATFTAPAAGTSTVLRSTVTDAQGISAAATFAVYVKTAGGNRVVALGETTEGSAVGWVAQLNANIRNGGGGGYAPSGSTSQFLLGNGTAATALPTGLTVSGTALSTIASGAALGATSAQASGTSTQIMHGDGSKDTALDTTLTVGGTALSTIKSGAAAGATALQSVSGGSGNGTWYVTTTRTVLSGAGLQDVWTLGSLPAYTAVDVECKLIAHSADTSTKATSVTLSISTYTDVSGNPTSYGTVADAHPGRSAAASAVAWAIDTSGATIRVRFNPGDATSYRVMAVITVTMNSKDA